MRRKPRARRTRAQKDRQLRKWFQSPARLPLPGWLRRVPELVPLVRMPGLFWSTSARRVISIRDYARVG